MSLKVGAVFYPQSVAGRDRTARLGMPFGWSEPLMVRYARPLFAGHDQPRCYAIDRLGHLSNWDDSVEEHVRLQCALAAGYGLDYFLVDTYVGATRGRVVHELSEAPLAHIARAGGSIEYAIMAVLERPRVTFPFNGVVSGPEEDREYDLSEQTARAIVEVAVPHWSGERYLKYRGRPCLWIFPGTSQSRAAELRPFVEHIRTHADRSGCKAPYIIAAARRRRDVPSLAAAGVDALTGYAYLPAFGPKARALQCYEEQLNAVEGEWHGIARASDLPWLPPAVAGWDASPRGCPSATWPEVSRRMAYPYVPIIYDSSADLFGAMLRKCRGFLEGRGGPPLLTITAWNEIGEGCALLPRVHPDGRLDDSYLRQVAALRRSMGAHSPQASEGEGAAKPRVGGPESESMRRALREAFDGLDLSPHAR